MNEDRFTGGQVAEQRDGAVLRRVGDHALREPAVRVLGAAGAEARGPGLEPQDSVPRILLTERGELPSGSPALLMGFGAGMCYAAQVITVP